MARKEIDDAGETTPHTLFLANGRRLAVNSKDHRIARPEECYNFILRNDNMALPGMFNAQFYRMDEE